MYRVVKMEKHKGEYLATVEWEVCDSRSWWLPWTLKLRTHTGQLVGSCTVWNCLPDFERASSPLERTLCNAWTKYRYENA